MCHVKSVCRCGGGEEVRGEGCTGGGDRVGPGGAVPPQVRTHTEYLKWGKYFPIQPKQGKEGEYTLSFYSHLSI